MKVIEYDEAKRVKCEHCHSVLEYINSDIEYGDYGVPYVRCPVCGEEIDLWDEDGMIITSNTIEFPKFFSHVNAETAISLNNDDVNRYIKECIDTLRSDGGVSIFVGSGDTMVFVFKQYEEDEYEVIVAKDYYELPAKFESEDYIHE